MKLKRDTKTKRYRNPQPDCQTAHPKPTKILYFTLAYLITLNNNKSKE